ncbi:MAG: response regulator [Acidobacteriota bacterium]
MLRGAKILVADDDPAVRHLLWKVLSMAGYEVILVEDGKSAVEAAQTERPDLALIDGLLPKLHGFLACKEIKSFPDPPKVFVLTGVYTRLTYSWEVRTQYGADEFLTKPFNIEDLLSRIADQLRDIRLNEAAA